MGNRSTALRGGILPTLVILNNGDLVPLHLTNLQLITVDPVSMEELADIDSLSYAVQDGNLWARGYSLLSILDLLHHHERQQHQRQRDNEPPGDNLLSHPNSRNPFTPGQLATMRRMANIAVQARLRFANIAAATNNIPVLQYLETLDSLPTMEGANRAALRGHLNVLQFLAARDIFPDVDVANPNQHSANRAAEYDDVEVVQLLADNGIFPTDMHGVSNEVRQIVVSAAARIGARPPRGINRLHLALARRSPHHEESVYEAMVQQRTPPPRDNRTPPRRPTRRRRENNAVPPNVVRRLF
jgi:hypothetical protein